MHGGGGGGSPEPVSADVLRRESHSVLVDELAQPVLGYQDRAALGVGEGVTEGVPSGEGEPHLVPVQVAVGAYLFGAEVLGGDPADERTVAVIGMHAEAPLGGRDPWAAQTRGVEPLQAPGHAKACLRVKVRDGIYPRGDGPLPSDRPCLPLERSNRREAASRAWVSHRDRSPGVPVPMRAHQEWRQNPHPAGARGSGK